MEECKTWMRFLDGSFDGDEAAITVLQKFMGYTLVNHCRAERMLILNGPPGVGPKRSVVGQVLAMIHGDDAVSQIELNNVNPFSLAVMEHARVNISTRLSITRQSTGVIKALISGEPVEMARMHEDIWVGQLTVKLIVDTHRSYPHRMPLDLDPRVLILKMQKFKGLEERDTWAKLETEKEAILSWMRDGMGELQAHGF